QWQEEGPGAVEQPGQQRTGGERGEDEPGVLLLAQRLGIADRGDVRGAEDRPQAQEDRDDDDHPPVREYRTRAGLALPAERGRFRRALGEEPEAPTPGDDDRRGEAG